MDCGLRKSCQPPKHGGKSRDHEYRFTNAYCVDGKKETNHPLAAKIAERYGIDEETMMTYYCQGYSIGEIMLALKTSQMEGVDIILRRYPGWIGWPGCLGEYLERHGTDRLGEGRQQPSRTAQET